ncbi:MAG: thioredoxin-disulfide reductase [Eubacteriaceae bacterium]|nr:thioredoxin-disulfide reductase [Eubacteriaceae bacterium]MDD4507371.1 thioredoxin-disulfide reductase [Eubacteriaceae bacterium]
MKVDVMIIGGGPAGLSAGLYAARGMLDTVIIENGGMGGQIATTDAVENYPGATPDVTGPQLAQRMREQCLQFGVTFQTEAFKGFEKKGQTIAVTTDHGVHETKTLIIATGAQPRKLGCKGEDEHRGMGVSYCATCDANFFRNRHVAVVGGGDTAIEEALYLTKFASKVTVIHRRDQLRATRILADRAKSNAKLDIVWDSVVEEVAGDGIVQSVWLKNVKTGKITEMPVDGVFMFVGQAPQTQQVANQLTVDSRGYLVTDANMHTNIDGVFAAGDVREKSLRQAVTAAGDGAIAGVQAIRYIENMIEA